MQILNKYKKWNPILVPYTKNIWDFVLSLNSNIIENDVNKISEMLIENGKIIVNDKLVWSDYVNTKESFKNFGFTGIDNGFITYDKNKIINDSFMKLLKESIVTFEDEKLNLKPIKSNTNTYDTSLSIISENNEEFLKLNGGFLQAPFKVGKNYQVLPSVIDNSISFKMTIRPRNYINDGVTLNSLYDNNKGIIFYIGTRAENKFLYDYKYDFSSFKERGLLDNVCYDESYYKEEKYEIDTFYFNEKSDYIKEEKCEQEGYFEKDFIREEASINKDTLTLNNDVSINTEGYYEVKTDNKYLFFNNTKDGYNVETWDDNIDIVLTATTRENINMYLLLNNTKNGYTVDTIDEYIENKEKGSVTKKIKNDIINNAFAIRINSENAIGYRYIIEDCEGEDGFKVIEEYGHPNTICNDEWNNLTITLKKSSSNKMVVYIYVNNYLKFVSKEIPLLNLRELDEIEEKQEGVPFNISIGGGTMGLCDCISWDYRYPFKYILPLEENFAGSFIGDIKYFGVSIN